MCYVVFEIVIWEGGGIYKWCAIGVWVFGCYKCVVKAYDMINSVGGINFVINETYLKMYVQLIMELMYRGSHNKIFYTNAWSVWF